MKLQSHLPGVAAAHQLPGWAMPAAILAVAVAVILGLPGPAIFVVALAAAIGLGLTIAEWRRGADAPSLAIAWDE